MSRWFWTCLASVVLLGGPAAAQAPSSLRNQAVSGAAIQQLPSSDLTRAAISPPVAQPPAFDPCIPQSVMMQVPRPLESSELLEDSNELLTAIAEYLGETRDDGELPIDQRIYEKTLLVAAFIDAVCPDGQCPQPEKD